MQDLSGKIAFVTGGSSGIGLGVVKVLAAAGMKVAFTYRQPQHRDEALAYFAAHPEQRVQAIRLDVTDRGAFAAAADEAEQALGGPVQVLINNAGVGVHGLMEHATYADWDWVMGVNVGGVINGVMTFLPRMLASGLPGHIVNVVLHRRHCRAGFGGSVRDLEICGGRAHRGAAHRPRRPTHRRLGVLPGARKIQYRRQRPQPARRAGRIRLRGARAGNRARRRRSSCCTPWMRSRRAEYVLEGIRSNRLFIISHPEFREVLTARSKLLLGSIPDEPINQARADSARWLLSSPVYEGNS